MAHLKSAILAFARNLFARETLPPPLPAEPRRTAGPGVARLLFAAEALPEAPAAEPGPPGARRRVLSLLFAPEALPEDAPAAPRARAGGAVAALFAAEALPEEPPEGPAAGPRRRGRWLEWLFKPEKLDPS